MLCYYGDDMEEYRRWEDNIKMNFKIYSRYHYEKLDGVLAGLRLSERFQKVAFNL